MKQMLIGGIDEAGRGPLAGPVSVALAIVPKGFRFWHPRLGKIKDCKQLSAKRREEWYAYLMGCPKFSFVHTYVSSGVIDRINILRATNRGAARLIARSQKKPDMCYLDGSLSLPINIPHKVVIGGDERIPVIAAASIIAKVRRDRLMRRLAKKYPAYNFDGHKGYATRIHIETIQKIGPSKIHRASFISNFV